MLFLLKDDQGRALLMAETGDKTEADTFGRNHLPEFCGESVEIDTASLGDAEEFLGVRTVRLVRVVLNPDARSRRGITPQATVTHLWVRGPRLPDDVESDDLLTPEDRRDLTLDHIARTSALVGRVEILKWA